MEIKYLGHSAFFIKTKTARVVTDPFDPQMVGLKFPKIEADIVTVSHEHQDHDKSSLVSGDLLVINLPGEYEKRGVRVFGYKSYHDKNQGKDRGENTLFKIEAEDITMLHCGDLGHVLQDSLLDEIGDVDVLLVPVGGHFTIDAEDAITVVKAIDPAIVIPMHYNHQGLNQKVFSSIAPLEEFLKKYGNPPIEPVDQLTIKKEDLTDEMKLVVMNIS